MPRPYESHEPIDGRPAICEPVWKNVIAGIVVDRFGEHRFDEADVVDDAAMVRQEFAEPCAGLAVLGEFEDRAGQRNRRLLGGHAGESLAAADVVGQLLAVLFVEQRLVVEQVLLRGAAGLEQVDDAFDARRELQARCARGAALTAAFAAMWPSDSPSKRAERNAADAGGRVPKKWRRVTCCRSSIGIACRSCTSVHDRSLIR